MRRKKLQTLSSSLLPTAAASAPATPATHSAAATFHWPMLPLIVARWSSRSASCCFSASLLSNCALPLPTASATLTFPFFQ